MKTFTEWLNEAIPGLDAQGRRLPYIDGIPQQPNNQPQQPNNQPQQPNQPQQVSLSTLANKVGDLRWHQLYDTFTKQYARMPQDPNVTKMGQALYQAATTNNMNLIQPFLAASGGAATPMR